MTTPVGGTARGPATTSRKRKGNAVQVMAAKGESAKQAVARGLVDPVVHAGFFLSDLNKQHEHVDSTAFVAEIKKHAQAVTTGNLSRLEEMLTAQAHSLDGLFNLLLHKSCVNIAHGYVDAGETYMKLGLRAQAQCRATAESIAAIKNPPSLAFVRQANISAGPQQVNNGVAQAVPSSRAENSENQPSKLLEAKDGERLDARTPGTAAGADPDLVPMEKIHRTENARG
jgi:hypothetical protein